jgi:methanethiol S-methyltransferase
MLWSHVLLGVLWIVFGALHSILASARLKRKLQVLLGKSFKYYRLFYTLFAFLTLAGVLIYQFTLDSFTVFHVSTATKIIGAVIAASGLILMLVCIRHYFLSLSGLLSLFREHVKPELIVSDVHRYVRHPLYLGTFVFIWGAWIFWPMLSLAIANTVITLYTIIAIKWEEDKLIDEFGEAYSRYRSSVPALLPRILRSRKNN